MFGIEARQKGLRGAFVNQIFGVCIFLILAATVLPEAIAADLFDPNNPAVSRDTYYKTLGIISGPRALVLTDADYPRPSELPISESRVIIWVLAQQHNYWGAFVFGVLVLVVLLEIGSLMVRTRESTPTIRWLCA
jgi:hypothetical protein